MLIFQEVLEASSPFLDRELDVSVEAEGDGLTVRIRPIDAEMSKAS